MSKTKLMVEVADAFSNSIGSALAESEALSSRDDIEDRLQALRNEVDAIRSELKPSEGDG